MIVFFHYPEDMQFSILHFFPCDFVEVSISLTYPLCIFLYPSFLHSLLHYL